MKVTKELRALPDEERVKKLEEFKKELLKLNVEVATGANPANSGKLRQTKKNIARILTLQKEEVLKE
tara:strand:+ start:20170 stop:20370 length:201 start_codon:yes stop_codon:yes gene_type:complete